RDQWQRYRVHLAADVRSAELRLCEWAREHLPHGYRSMKRAASENGVSEYEKATSKERFTLAEVPAASPSAPLPAGASAIPTASPASPVAPLPPLPEGELVTLGDREIADNLRFEQLHDHLALQGIDMSRASWHWPESFFKSEARGRPSQATRAKELLCAFYAG